MDSAELRSPAAAIVGSGIAGLCAGIALRRAGWNVEIFEKSSFKNEVGAAVTVPSNATRILTQWNFDFKKSRPVEHQQIRMVMAQGLETVFQASFDWHETDYGYKSWAFHRVDLHNQLREMAIGKAGAGAPVKITLATPITSLDCEKGSITTASGEVVSKDLIVVADGAHSELVETIVGRKASIQKLGRSAFRSLIPFDRLVADPDVRPFFENESTGFLCLFTLPDMRMLILYPCRGQDVMNMAFLHDTRPQDMDKDDWNSPASIEDVMEQAHGFHPSVNKILEKIDDVKVYNLSCRPPLDRYTKGKALVIGDAAHTMLPSHAQGGAMCIEDAAALEVLFSGLEGTSDIPGRCELYNKVRLPRDSVVQLLSNSGPMGHSKIVEEVRAIDPELQLPDDSAQPYDKPWGPVFLEYDAFDEARKALRATES